MEGTANTRGHILEAWGMWRGGQASDSEGDASGGKEELPDLCLGHLAGCELGCVFLHVHSLAGQSSA